MYCPALCLSAARKAGLNRRFVVVRIRSVISNETHPPRHAAGAVGADVYLCLDCSGTLIQGCSYDSKACY